MCYPTGGREAPPRDFPKAGNMEPPARRRGVWTAAGFESPPGSGKGRSTGASREKPGEKAVTGRREYVGKTNDTTLVKQAEGGSSPRPGPGFITDCLTFNFSEKMENYIGRKCIVRCYSAGVFFGEVKEVTSDANGLNVRLANARKVWYWDGAAAVEQLSQEGCNDSSKITVAVPELVVADAIQVIPCSDKAIANIEAKAEWKR